MEIMLSYKEDNLLPLTKKKPLFRGGSFLGELNAFILQSRAKRVCKSIDPLRGKHFCMSQRNLLMGSVPIPDLILDLILVTVPIAIPVQVRCQCPRLDRA